MKPILNNICKMINPIVYHRKQKYPVALDKDNNIVIFSEPPDGYDGFVSDPILEDKIGEIIIVTNFNGLNGYPYRLYQYTWWSTYIKDYSADERYEIYKTYISENDAIRGHKKICEIIKNGNLSVSTHNLNNGIFVLEERIK